MSEPSTTSPLSKTASTKHSHHRRETRTHFQSTPQFQKVPRTFRLSSCFHTVSPFATSHSQTLISHRFSYRCHLFAAGILLPSLSRVTGDDEQIHDPDSLMPSPRGEYQHNHDVDRLLDEAYSHNQLHDQLRNPHLQPQAESHDTQQP